jgi:hypothetical protein
MVQLPRVSSDDPAVADGPKQHMDAHKKKCPAVTPGLIRRAIKSREGDATSATAKAVLKTMEGVNWTEAPEPKTPRPRKS